MEKFTTEQACKLAIEFSGVLKEWLTTDELKAINEENKKRNDNTCATHDYCDSNQAMIDAYFLVFGKEPDINADFNFDITNAAWDIAKQNNFYVN